jgi:hypothetical protein
LLISAKDTATLVFVQQRSSFGQAPVNPLSAQEKASSCLAYNEIASQQFDALFSMSNASPCFEKRIKETNGECHWQGSFVVSVVISEVYLC